MISDLEVTKYFLGLRITKYLTKTKFYLINNNYRK